MKGRIISVTGGLYTVECNHVTYPCRARGNFRHNNIRPAVGDIAEIELAENGENSIKELLPRKNILIRPPVANLDNIFVCVSVKQPDFSTITTDKLITIAEHNNIEPAVIITKSDLDTSCADELKTQYEKCGLKAFAVSSLEKKGIEELLSFIKSQDNKLSAFAGVSGAGKSTLMNSLFPSFNCETGELSKNLRGKNTTRKCNLYPLDKISEGFSGYLADTPGFSMLDFEHFDFYSLENLQFLFREFDPFITKCKYTKCTHTKEEGCAIIKGVEDGIIPKFRHASYLTLYDELKSKKIYK